MRHWTSNWNKLQNKRLNVRKLSAQKGKVRWISIMQPRTGSMRESTRISAIYTNSLRNVTTVIIKGRKRIYYYFLSLIKWFNNSYLDSCALQIRLMSGSLTKSQNSFWNELIVRLFQEAKQQNLHHIKTPRPLSALDRTFCADISTVFSSWRHNYFAERLLAIRTGSAITRHDGVKGWLCSWAWSGDRRDATVRSVSDFFQNI